MPEPLAPHDIARRTFDVARRGYEQQEVRGFLHEVSALVEKLARDELELRERAERAEARLGMAEKPDEATLLEVLGEETTRVLTSAREAAGEIRSKAEEAAERVIADATSETTELRRQATEDAEALMAQTHTERDAILEAARTELDRRSAEAEEAAQRIREEAQAQAQTLRDEGAADLARAREEAEGVLQAARQEGRTMVAEAQAVRERVLRDLAVRRKKARLQVEKLNAGRERLLSAYDVVRRTVDEATDELTVALSDARLAADAAARRVEDEPEPTIEQLDAEVSTAGLVDLPIAGVEHDHEDETPGPFSGEVPAVVPTSPTPTADAPVEVPADDAPAAPAPEAPVAASSPVEERRGRKSRRRKGFEGLPASELTVVEPPSEHEGVRILAEPATVPEGAASDDVAPDEPTGQEGSAPSEELAAETPAPEAPAAEFSEPGAASDAQAASPPADEDEPDPKDAPAASDSVESASAEESPDHGGGHGSAAQVFARLRAEQTDAAPEEAVADEVAVAYATPAGEDAPATGSDASPTDAPHAAAFTARAAAVDSVEKELGRRLKRALADEQNEVLDLLRRAKPKGIDDLVPSADDHAARWSDAATPALVDAARAGASWAGSDSVPVTDDLARDLAADLTGPLRDRIDRSFSASDGNLDDVADRVRALYREWKGQRLSEAIRHHVAAAYARGVLDAVEVGTLVQWVVDPSAGPCPDCDDNVLAGQIPKGEEFPTGNPCAPAHPGCHCLVLAAAT
jgi:DivIVA domain-containing protein